jgi:hypothetical protein
MISPRHDEARKVAAIGRQQLKVQGAIGAEDHAVTVLRRMDLGPEACRDLLHYAPGRVVGFHSRTAGGFRPDEKWTVRETNCETVMLERNGKVRQFNHLLRVSGTCSFLDNAGQCRTVDQVVLLPDGSDAKGWYVSLSRAREAMHVYTRDKAALRQSVMHPGERMSVWELVQAVPRSKVQSRDRMMPDLWATR